MSGTRTVSVIVLVRTGTHVCLGKTIPTYHPLKNSIFYTAAARRTHQENVKPDDTIICVRLGHSVSGNQHWRFVIVQVSLMAFTRRYQSVMGKR